MPNLDAQTLLFADLIVTLAAATTVLGLRWLLPAHRTAIDAWGSGGLLLVLGRLMAAFGATASPGLGAALAGAVSLAGLVSTCWALSQLTEQPWSARRTGAITATGVVCLAMLNAASVQKPLQWLLYTAMLLTAHLAVLSTLVRHARPSAGRMLLLAVLGAGVAATAMRVVGPLFAQTLSAAPSVAGVIATRLLLTVLACGNALGFCLLLAERERTSRQASDQQRLIVLGQANELLEQRVSERTRELQAANAGLAASEARFRLLADSAPVLLWVTDRDGRIEFANRAYEEFFGVSVKQLRAQGWAPLVHPDDVDAYVGAYRTAVGTRERFLARARIRRSDGHWRWIESHALARVTPEGEFIGHVGVSPDVTELIEAQRRLAAADARKNEFLAMLSHELRNPLAPIATAIRLIARGEALSGTGQQAVAMIERQVKQLTRLVDDLLKVARITQGRIDLALEPLVLQEVVAQAVDAARARFVERGQAVALHMAPSPIVVQADAVRLAQVLDNLLVNASKYTPPGGRVTVQVESARGEARVAVQDNGVGITPESLPQLFEPFTQLHASFDRGEGGLGLGLALVKRIVELHGGRVSAYSDGPHQGAVFSFWLRCLQSGQKTA